MRKTSVTLISLCILMSMMLGISCFAFAEGRTEPGDITFAGLSVCDTDDCMIRINRIVPNDTWGYTVHASFENRSDDMTYHFAVVDAFADGWEANPVFSIEVEPGQTSEGEILFPVRFFESVGMDFYTDIEMSFCVVDADDFYSDPVFEGTVHVYPYGKENAARYVRVDEDTDIVLVDNSNLKVVVIDGVYDDDWAFTMHLLIENKSRKDITIFMDEVMVNGCDADPFFTEAVHAGKSMAATVGWFEDDFEMNEITSVEYIDFLLSAFDNEEWDSEGLVDDYFTVYFEE